MYYLHKTTIAVSCVKPNASQWEATLRDGVGFATVYRRIYRRKFLTLSNQTSRYIRECIRMVIYSRATLVAVTSITKTRLYNFDPLKPHFYIVKLGFAGVYIIFLISIFWAEIWKLSGFFIWKFSIFMVVKFSIYLNRRVFVMRVPCKRRYLCIWDTGKVHTQIRRWCTVCLNYRKLRVKWNNLKSLFRSIFLAYIQRQSPVLSVLWCWKLLDCWVEVLRPSKPIRIMSSQSVYLTFSGRAFNSVHILSLEIDNCPSWISKK